MFLNMLASEKDLIQQEEIECDDQCRSKNSGDGRNPLIDQRAHNITSAGEHDQRDNGERQAKRKDHLTDHEGACRIQAYEDDNQGWEHGNDAPHPGWNMKM